MRWILVGLAVLVLAGWLGHTYELNLPRTPQVRTSQWRRTVDGWERIAITCKPVFPTPNLLGLPTPQHSAHPHPIVVSLLMAMLSTFALVANDCGSVSSRPPASEPRPARGSLR